MYSEKLDVYINYTLSAYAGTRVSIPSIGRVKYPVYKVSFGGTGEF